MPASAPDAVDADGDGDGDAGSRRKRRDTGQQRTAGRAWLEEEEALFLAALDTHGRDWKACAAHVGSRDARQIASHAQKHFIKLALAGALLPAKVPFLATLHCCIVWQQRLLALCSGACMAGSRAAALRHERATRNLPIHLPNLPGSSREHTHTNTRTHIRCAPRCAGGGQRHGLHTERQAARPQQCSRPRVRLQAGDRAA